LFAERFAVRVEPRSRPLLWRAKPGGGKWRIIAEFTEVESQPAT
jgi:hypothetical protein